MDVTEGRSDGTNSRTIWKRQLGVLHVMGQPYYTKTQNLNIPIHLFFFFAFGKKHLMEMNAEA